MMKRITRAQLRGQPLDEDCKKYGKSVSGQFAVWDKRCFCTGIWNKMTDDFERKCIECTAWQNNAEPLRDCSTCAYGKYNDYHGVKYCYDPDLSGMGCIAWSHWTPKDGDK